jgi:hypothetical protein
MEKYLLLKNNNAKKTLNRPIKDFTGCKNTSVIEQALLYSSQCLPAEIIPDLTKKSLVS